VMAVLVGEDHGTREGSQNDDCFCQVCENDSLDINGVAASDVPRRILWGVGRDLLLAR
jgi:hypothetical protein